ncbi:MAG: fumarylacetoacetate hydrolase family protein [Alphaproteobacteria bacterium]|nr:fumarylacetoacetate hydrolase family protein [Alphaproteobacteria bacterium]
MKLASLKNNKKDGVLVVVSRDLTRCIEVPSYPTLQQALENWTTAEPVLKNDYEALNQKQIEGKPFNPSKAHSPLPRSYQWLDGSAYVNHVELVRKARGAEMPASFWTDPLMYQGGSDAFIGPRDPILAADESYGIDFESEVAVITDDVPMGISADKAGSHIKLLMLVNDVSLRGLIPGELSKGFGFIHGKPATSFSPVAVTPDEVEWTDFKVPLPLYTYINGKEFGRPNAGVDMTFNFAQLIAHAAKTRVLSAGTIVGSGTVSNKDKSAGSSCLAEKRMLEVIESGAAVTPFLKFGDQVKIEMLDAKGQSIFGAIDQAVKKYP